MPTAIVSTKGQVVVPKEYRLKYGLKAGSKVQVVDYGRGLSIVPLPEDPIAALRGLLVEGPSLTGDLLAERQRDWSKEQAKLEQSLRSG